MSQPFVLNDGGIVSSIDQDFMDTKSSLRQSSVSYLTENSTHVDVRTEEDQQQEVPAYFALEFPDAQWTYYLQKLSVSLGRTDGPADIKLGQLKNISRLHARIEYEEELERFVLVVIGRNGAFVDGHWKEPGMRVPLGERALIQISTRSFYFMLPPSNSNVPTDISQHGSGEIPALDSTGTTADGSHSPSTTTPERTHLVYESPVSSPASPADDNDDDDDDDDFTLGPKPSKPAKQNKPKGRGRGNNAGRGKGKGKGKNVLVALRERSKRFEVDDDDEDPNILDETIEDIPDTKPEDAALNGSDEEEEDDQVMQDQPESKAVVQPIEEDAAESPLVQLRDEADMESTSPPEAPPKRPRGRPPKRKLVDVDGGEQDEGNPASKKKKKTTTASTTASTAKPKVKAAPTSLFTTAPAPLPVATKTDEDGTPVTANGKKQKEKGKAKAKKSVPDGPISVPQVKEESNLDDQDQLTQDDEKVVDEEKKEEEAKPQGPPPAKPPFTFPLLCYRALKALEGKAPYRAITKWLETEYPYFALATKEGKDGWENSTRHTLSSHRAFVKIDRKPEERGKGCFWSFDPEYETQFADQWQAAVSNAKNPSMQRPHMRLNVGPPPTSGPSNASGSNGGRPPFPPPWGVTPPHLMPGYPPPPPGFRPGGPPPPGHPMQPYPYPGMPGMPMPPHPMHMQPHPGGAGAPLKPRPPKKPKQALGAAFSRAPLVRPGLGEPGASGSGDGGEGAPSNNDGEKEEKSQGNDKASPLPSVPLTKNPEAEPVGLKDEGKDKEQVEREKKEKAERNAQKLADFNPPVVPESTPPIASGSGSKTTDPKGDEQVASKDVAEKKVKTEPKKKAKVPNAMYPPRPPFGFPPMMPPGGPPPPPPPPHASGAPPPTSKVPVVLSALPGSKELMSFYEGKLYLNPASWPNLKDADLKMLNDDMRNVGEVVSWLMSQRGMWPHPPPHPGHPGHPGHPPHPPPPHMAGHPPGPYIGWKPHPLSNPSLPPGTGGKGPGKKKKAAGTAAASTAAKTDSTTPTPALTSTTTENDS